MPQENITQAELAKRLDRTTKQIRNLTSRHGMPRNADGSYPWPESHEWWVKFKMEEKDRRRGNDAGVSDLDRARAAKEWALAKMRELELEERMGELVSADYLARQVEDCCTAVRATLNNVPGKYAPRIIGVDSVGKAQLILQDVVDEVLRSLQEAAEQIPDTDGDADPPDSPREVAA